MSKHLYGIHDRGSWESLISQAGVSAWALITEEIAADGPGPAGNYGDLAPHITPIVRLNYGYGSKGTIPGTVGEAVVWALALGRFAARSTARYFIVGNEPNHRQEWPGGQIITPDYYALVYRLAYGAIKDARPDALISPAPVAPWNVEAGDWLAYFERMLNHIGYSGAGIDWLALHTYTHGTDPGLVKSIATMAPPYEARYFHFKAYRQFMERIPPLLKDRQVIITEADQDEPWADQNNGWIRAAYAEIADWNKTAGTQKIDGLILYRWPRDLDQWSMEDKPGVIADFTQALAQRYLAPARNVSPVSQRPPLQNGGNNAPVATPTAAHNVYLPNVATGPTTPPTAPTPPPGQPDRIWDPRLDQLGVTLEKAQVTPGQPYWRLAEARWLDEKQAGGRHHIFTLPIGAPMRVSWPGHTVTFTKDWPMFNAGNCFTVEPDTAEPRDRIHGLGLGTPEQPRHTIHTCFLLTWIRTTAELPKPIPTPEPVKPPAPAPTPEPLPMPTPTVTPDALIPILARVIGVSPAVARGVLAVESGNQYAGHQGRPLIRLEAHLLWRRWGESNPSAYARHFRFSPGDKPWTGHLWRPTEADAWQEYHGNQAREWAALELAQRLAGPVAIECMSIGAAQILGSHYERLGYSSAQAMLADFASPAAQVAGFFAFINSDATLRGAMRARAWAQFARIYNGPGQVELYSRLIAEAVAKEERN